MDNLRNSRNATWLLIALVVVVVFVVVVAARMR